jgi:hypothetical protein
MFEVIYCSVGCLPDSEMAEFAGTLAECETFVKANADDYVRPEIDHDLYCLEIVEVTDFEMAGSDREYFGF